MSNLFLYIKEHQNTGLKYFGKTTGKNPVAYKGSGTYWKRHLKLHGTNVKTVWFEKFSDIESMSEFANFFSEFNDIVNANDSFGNKLWANLIPENGIDGIPSGVKRSKEVIDKLTGRKCSDEHKLNISKALRNRSKEVRESAASKIRGKSNPKLKLSGQITGSMLWWNNGEINKRSLTQPSGFVRGKLIQRK